ncbi:MAG: hypothetical protein QW478_05005 [Candidatus Micrarchaeaceae archaeon]
MEVPILDLRKLPADLRKAFAASLNIIRIATDIYNGDTSDNTVMPISLRTEYLNLYNFHLSIINTTDTVNKQKELDGFKKRFDIFAPGLTNIRIRDKLAIMVEFSQIVSLIIYRSYLQATSNSKFKFADTKKYNRLLSANANLRLSILNASKLAILYSQYKDESLMDIISPYLVEYLNIEPFRKTEISYPDFGGNYKIASDIAIEFEGLLTDIKIYERKINMYSKYISSDDPEYLNTILSNYKSLAVNYLTYPRIYLEEPEKA